MKILFVIDRLELKYFEFNNLVTNFWLIKSFLKRGHEVRIATIDMLKLKSAMAYTSCYNSYIEGEEICYDKESLSEYKIDAINAIEEILQKGKTPIVVGGTGLYVNSLIYGIDYPEVETDLEYRAELERIVEEKGLEYLYNKAVQIDPEAMQNISKNDQKRILRVLEIYKETGKTKTQLEIESRKNGIPYDYKVFALNMPREILYDRINQRVDIMIQKGLVEEVKKLYNKYGEKLTTAMQGIGYKEVVEYLKGNLTKEEMIEKIKMETRRYAKRQLTWFRKNKEIKWIDGLSPLDENIQCILEEYSGKKEEK